jgi:hypothetical protein
MSVPSLQLNKRITQNDYQAIGELFSIKNEMYQETNATGWNIPALGGGNLFNPANYTEAITTTGVADFQFSLDPTKSNHFVYFALLVLNVGLSVNRAIGIGIRWFDKDNNVIHNDGSQYFTPIRDTIYPEISAIAPAGAVRGSITWDSLGNMVWSGASNRRSNFQRYLIEWS